jgi:hypothetical protein
LNAKTQRFRDQKPHAPKKQSQTKQQFFFFLKEQQPNKQKQKQKQKKPHKMDEFELRKFRGARRVGRHGILAGTGKHRVGNTLRDLRSRYDHNMLRKNPVAVVASTPEGIDYVDPRMRPCVGDPRALFREASNPYCVGPALDHELNMGKSGAWFAADRAMVAAYRDGDEVGVTVFEHNELTRHQGSRQSTRLNAFFDAATPINPRARFEPSRRHRKYQRQRDITRTTARFGLGTAYDSNGEDADFAGPLHSVRPCTQDGTLRLTVSNRKGPVVRASRPRGKKGIAGTQQRNRQRQELEEQQWQEQEQRRAERLRRRRDAGSGSISASSSSTASRVPRRRRRRPSPPPAVIMNVVGGHNVMFDKRLYSGDRDGTKWKASGARNSRESRIARRRNEIRTQFDA